ncbi:MAG: hypothetical protein GQ534_05100 [Candidatus Delongbacteria bacterium]|nr:hypothetical protein [Candidatus Delongbacteria bacterium]
MKKSTILVLILILGSSLLFSKVDLKSKEYDFGFTLGYWMSGDVDISGYTAEKDGSFLLRGFVDAYLIPKLAMGAFVNFAPISQDGGEFKMFEFGCSIKPRFFINEDLAIKPGINFSYRTSSGDLEMDGLGINLSIEVQKALETMILSFEGGFLSQPVGGDGWVDISWAPIMYIGAGLTF